MKLLHDHALEVAVLKKINSLLQKNLGNWVVSFLAKKVILGKKPLGVQPEGTLYFFPHGDPGNILLHGLFAKVTSLRGIPSKVVVPKPRWHMEWREENHPADLPFVDNRFDSFSDAVDHLESLASGDGVLARGIIDEFMRWCPTDFFEGNYVVGRAFLEKLSLDIYSAKRALADASGVVIGESAYIYNRALVSAAEGKRVPMWVLNSGGYWARADSSQDENFSAISFAEITEMSSQEPGLMDRARSYVEERFAGLSKLDLDSSTAFSGTSLPEHLRKKKILALHAFRDATQLPVGGAGPGRESLFRTFYEWVDFVFSHIRSSADEWAIRPHPSSRFYRGDRQILESLIKRHGLQRIDRADGISTVAILENRLPVYTHNGTISVETALLGYRSYVCANLYPDEITVFTRTREELSRALSLPFEDATEPIDPRVTAEQLKVLLYQRFHPPLVQLRPPFGGVRASTWRMERANFLRIMFYVRRFLQGADVAPIRSATDEISTAVTEAALRRSEKSC